METSQKGNNYKRRWVKPAFVGLNCFVFFVLPMNGKLFQLFGLERSGFNFLPISLGFIFVLSIFTDAFDFKKVIKNRFFRLFFLLFAMYAVSSFYHLPIGEWGNVIMKKISLLLVPFAVFSNAKLYYKNAKYLYKSFLFGVFTTILVLDFRALFDWLETGALPYYVFYSKILHPSYLGLSLLMLMIINFYRFANRKIETKTFLMHLLITFFLMLHVVLLMSKAILILMVLSVLIYQIILFRYEIKKAALYAIFWIGPIAILMSLGINTRFEKMISNRFHELSDYNKESGSTSFRALILKRSPEILEQNWLFGVGYGNETTFLDHYYDQKEWLYAKEKSYNTHNQFLQTWLGIGIGGLFVLSVLLFGPFMLAINPTTKLMLFCFVFMFCTEAMLERRAGIILFVIFYSLLIGLTPLQNRREKKRLLTFD